MNVVYVQHEIAPGTRLMRRREVAYLFRVTSNTVAAWVRRGVLAEQRDDHDRPCYRQDDVYALLRQRAATRR